MKKVYLLIAMVTVAILASCTKEQEDFFSDSSANRADAAIAADIQVLTNATNGWLMQYYPDAQQSYGGYNMIVRFGADGKVEVRGEDSDETQTSHYSLIQSAGITLVFDTYNEEFHLYSDPSAPLGGDFGTGWDGDYDFSILKATAEEVILKGKKTGNRIVMTPMQTADWDAYLAQIENVEEAMLSKKYGIHVGDEEIIAMRYDRTLSITYDLDGEEVKTTIPYIITPQGYKFYEPVTIKGQTISGFTFSEGTDVFPGSDNSGVTLNIIYPTMFEHFVENYWCTSMSNIGEFGAPYWNAVKTQIMPSLGEQLGYFYFGAAIPSFAESYGNYWGITFNSSGYAGVIGFQYQQVSDDEIILALNMNGNKGNGDWYVNNAYFHYLAVPFGASTKATPQSRLFKITGDNTNAPNMIILTDENEPTNVITLLASHISDPFNN